MHDHHPTGSPQSNPPLEAWPGGPNPGAIVMMLEEKERRERTEKCLSIQYTRIAPEAEGWPEVGTPVRHQHILKRPLDGR